MQVTPDVVVVGSLNVDLVARMPRLPDAGETILGHSFSIFLGGKGFNQAVAASRSGSSVAMVGKLGQDDFGHKLETALEAEQINHSFVTHCPDPSVSTGVATINVDSAGHNSIVVVPGANFELQSADVIAASKLISQTKILLLQLEVPLETCQQAAQIAHVAGVKVLLTVAPVPNTPLPTALTATTDIILLNEIEVGQLASIYNGSPPLDPIEAGRSLLKAMSGPQAIVVTLGAQGAVWVELNTHHSASGFEVTPLDTTAAGDTFAGALATALSRQLPVEQCLRFANAAGALAVTRSGASASIPYLADIEKLWQIR